jgi:hypothetical protein
MADFCNLCAEEMGFSAPEIDVYQIVEELVPSTYMLVLCEGCGMQSVGKGADGQGMVAYPSTERKNEYSDYVEVDWVYISDYEKRFKTLKLKKN